MLAKRLTMLPLSIILLLLFLVTSCQKQIQYVTSKGQEIPMIQKTILTGQQVHVAPVLEGTMNLYFRMIPISEANLYNPYFPDNEPAEVPQFFIGEEELIRIDEWNYESVLKEVMKDKPDLIKKLGRQGFRFENLKQMIYYYNQHQ